jgi:hypothetical protein
MPYRPADRFLGLLNRQKRRGEEASVRRKDSRGWNATDFPREAVETCWSFVHAVPAAGRRKRKCLPDDR